MKYPQSAYLHIPFCHRRCFYCDFPVVPLGDRANGENGPGSSSIKLYLELLHREIDIFGKTIFNNLSKDQLISVFAKILDINESNLDNLVQRGLDPDTYIYTQCKDAVSYTHLTLPTKRIV